MSRDNEVGLSTDALFNLQGRIALVTGGGSGMSVLVLSHPRLPDKVRLRRTTRTADS